MLILASQSAARKTLLAGAGLRFETSPAQIDERELEAEVLGKGGDVVEVARSLAQAKALSVSANRVGDVVIGADQVLALTEADDALTARAARHGVIPANAGTSVFLPAAPSQTEVPAFAGMTRWVGEPKANTLLTKGSATEILHKPADMAEARRQLDRLKGRTHHLHSAVALARDGVVLWSEVETATLTMRSFSEAGRDRVLAQEGPAVLGSIGSYRLEGASVKLFERIVGDYFTILGLPLLPLLAALPEHAPDLLE